MHGFAWSVSEHFINGNVIGRQASRRRTAKDVHTVAATFADHAGRSAPCSGERARQYQRRVDGTKDPDLRRALWLKLSDDLHARAVTARQQLAGAKESILKECSAVPDAGLYLSPVAATEIRVPVLYEDPDSPGRRRR